MTGRRFDDETIACGVRALDNMRSGATRLTTAILLSDDGFEAARVPEGAGTDGRFASMASSMQALGEAVTAELQAGENEAIILQAAQGFTLQMRVTGHPFVVAAHFGSGDNLGTALVLVRTAAHEIASGLDELQAKAAKRPAPPIIAPPPTSAPVLLDPPDPSSAVAGF